MKCPICGEELRVSKKDENYLLCDNCKKRFAKESLEKRAAAKRPASAPQAPAHRKTTKPVEDSEKRTSRKRIPAEDAPRYSNIPPEHVRVKREKEMRENYDAMLNIDDEDDYGGHPVLITLIVLLIIAILAIVALHYFGIVHFIPFLPVRQASATAITALATMFFL